MLVKDGPFELKQCPLPMRRRKLQRCYPQPYSVPKSRDITAMNLPARAQAKALAVAAQAASRSQAVSENEVSQLSHLIDHAALSKLFLTHFSYVTALIEKLSQCSLPSRI